MKQNIFKHKNLKLIFCLLTLFMSKPLFSLSLDKIAELWQNKKDAPSGEEEKHLIKEKVWNFPINVDELKNGKLQMYVEKFHPESVPQELKMYDMNHYADHASMIPDRDYISFAKALYLMRDKNFEQFDYHSITSIDYLSAALRVEDTATKIDLTYEDDDRTVREVRTNMSYGITSVKGLLTAGVYSKEHTELNQNTKGKDWDQYTKLCKSSIAAWDPDLISVTTVESDKYSAGAETVNCLYQVKDDVLYLSFKTVTLRKDDWAIGLIWWRLKDVFLKRQLYGTYESLNAVRQLLP